MSDYQEFQGEAIERLQKYAGKEISREDFTTMNCAIFTEITEVCHFISEVNCIVSTDRVYTGLCKVGRDKCYSAYKHNSNRDVFTDIAKHISTGRKSLNASKRAAARTNIHIFNDVSTKKFGVHDDDAGLVHRIAGAWRVQTSHLNLYHALTGLKYIMENEPDYILLRDEPLFDVPLQKLTMANIMLNERSELLKAWMGI